MKVVVELSGAIVLAAILKDQRFVGKKVGVILSGGNMDMSPYFKPLQSKL
jgi:threonine dehydratase